VHVRLEVREKQCAGAVAVVILSLLLLGLRVRLERRQGRRPGTSAL
jgi:hypothetical protein